MQLDLFDQNQNSILGARTYEEFRGLLAQSGCTRCTLSGSRTHIVVDRGNSQARIMMVGEAPGENEDQQGLAFVGRAGKLMDGLFAQIGLDTNRDCLIANVVKCRPPDNRAPIKEEAAACLPFLARQIALVHPRVLLLLGATAFKHLIPNRGIFSMEEEAGRFFTDPQYPGIQLMVMYHPAYLLYDPRKRPVMEKHLQALKEYLIGHPVVAHAN